MKIFAIVGLSLLIILLGAQIYFFLGQEHQLGGTLSDAEMRLTKAQADEEELSANVAYLANPVNLEKELRARFNYKNPGETMIIIVPSSTSSTGQ